MDFNQFNTVAAAEKGAECHIKCPATLKPLFDNPDDPTADNGKPCIVVVLGGEAASVRAAIRAAQKARAAAAEDEDNLPDTSLAELHERMVESVLPRIIGFKNISKGSKPATKADADWFLNLNVINGQKDEKSFAEQLGEFSSKRANYLGNASSA